MNENETEKRELVFKEDGQEYAQVVKMLGNGRLDALCFDGTKRLCHIRGKLRKKVWINTGDIILLGLRDYQDAKAVGILKYTPDEAKNLKTYGALPENVKIETTTENQGEGEIEFEYGSDESGHAPLQGSHRPQGDEHPAPVLLPNWDPGWPVGHRRRCGPLAVRGSCHLPHPALCRRDPHLCHCLIPLQLWILAGGLRTHRNGGLRHLLDDAPLCPLTEADRVDF